MINGIWNLTRSIGKAMEHTAKSIEIITETAVSKNASEAYEARKLYIKKCEEYCRELGYTFEGEEAVAVAERLRELKRR